jgi:hypothetical protein
MYQQFIGNYSKVLDYGFLDTDDKTSNIRYYTYVNRECSHRMTIIIDTDLAFAPHELQHYIAVNIISIVSITFSEY